jgi:hypothetical protein
VLIRLPTTTARVTVKAMKISATSFFMVPLLIQRSEGAEGFDGGTLSHHYCGTGSPQPPPNSGDK